MFKREFDSLSAIVAKDLKAAFNFPRGVAHKVLNPGYRENSFHRGVCVDMDDIEKEKGQILILELTLQGQAEGKFRVAEVEFTYADVAGGTGVQKTSSDIIVTYTPDFQKVKQGRNREVLGQVERLKGQIEMMKIINERLSLS